MNDVFFKEGKINFDKVIDLIKIRTWCWCSTLVNRNYFHMWIGVAIQFVVWNLVKGGS